jgi:hypothetical protein
MGLALRGKDEVEAGESDDDAGDQFAEDRGQLQPHHQLGESPGTHKNDQKLAHENEGAGHLDLMVSDLKQ